jgi:predicted amidohydrolase
MERVRVAATQMLVRHRATRENLERHLALIDAAARQDVRLILFPELSLTGHNGSPEVVRDAMQADGPIVAAIADRARARGIHVSFGFAELFRGTHYNTQALVGPGGMIGLQRKVHASHDEFFLFRQAYDFDVFDCGFARIGTAICHDSDFFESWRILALKGAEIVLLPHAIRKINAPDGSLTFDGAGVETPAPALQAAQAELLRFPSVKHHDVMARTHGVYAILSNHVGFDGHSTHSGGAYVIGPDGLPKACSEPSVDDAIIVADLDPDLLALVRSSPWFQLRKRRPEAYAELGRAL